MFFRKACSQPIGRKHQGGHRFQRLVRPNFNCSVTDADKAAENFVLSRSEESRRYFRTVYDFPLWQKHSNQPRIIDEVRKNSRTNILKSILPSTAWCTGVAALLTAYVQAYDSNMLPAQFPRFESIPSYAAIVNITVVSLSLLLVFRTNASYGQWDAARKMKGLLVNRSQELMREACSLLPAEDTATKIMMGRWISAYAGVLRNQFQPEESLGKIVDGLLSTEELEWLNSSNQRPSSVIDVLSQIISSAAIPAPNQAQMNNNLAALRGVLGGCQRLLKDPIPMSYTRNSARLLFLWLTLLPFALFSSCGVWTAPVVAAVSAVLCSIEEIGVQIEEPSTTGMLPLEAIGDRIQADVITTLLEDEKTKTMRGEVDTAALRAAAQPSKLDEVPGKLVLLAEQVAVVGQSSNNQGTGGAGQKGERRVLLSKLETETKDMKDNLQRLKQRATELSTKAQQASDVARKERANAVLKLGEMDEQLKTSQEAGVYSEITQLKDSLTTRESDVASLVSELMLEQQSNQQLLEQVALLQMQLSETENMLTSEKSIGEGLSQQLQITQVDLNTSQSSLADMSQKLREEEFQRATLQSEIQALRSDLDRVTAVVETRQKEADVYRAAAEKAEQQVVDAAALRQAMMAELTETSDSFAELLAEALSRAESAEADKVKVEAEVRMLQSKIVSADAALSRLETQLLEEERKGIPPSGSNDMEFEDVQKRIAELEGLLGGLLSEVEQATVKQGRTRLTQDTIEEVKREAELRSARVAAELAAESGARSEAEDNLRVLQSELLQLKEASQTSRHAAEKELKEMQLLISEVKAKAAETAAFVGKAAKEGPKKGKSAY
ncbi:hypothetical protein CEUSTIGMA_g11405.t1 [Chlamydomonas eustigma]|uniref:Uncharacterized protein n=1 Tax=Chlamydomonas eustigma TaxID=1157962 RepID=A0A250XMG6_9CHLO|nr:hypothetical protein CEUSTIGMA_g11405.t1 [Chlamydomonas eustigma]|eukprot:GAX83980.1 hypothetical protein CEUSTIGMA_g11405.t1 [Chlamydomonas eustigma]